MRPSLLLTTLLATLVVANAQGPGGRTEAPPVPVGTALPDVTVTDGDGNDFPLLQKLKGKHAVITFGCLT